MKTLTNIESLDELLSEIANGDYEVGMVELGKRKYSFPVPDGFIELGKLESDPLAIEEKSKEVVQLDHEVTGRIMGYVAKDVFAFMKALARIDHHWEECEKNEELYDDETFMNMSAAEAGEIAGGEKYRNFYFNMFGI